MALMNRISALLLVLPCLLVSFCQCASNPSRSTNSSSSTSQKSIPFPTVIIGKDTSSLYYVNVSFGSPPQIQGLRIDIAQPYVWLLSDDPLTDCDSSLQDCSLFTRYDANTSSTSLELNGGYLYHFEFMDTVTVNATSVMDTMNFTNLNTDNVAVDEVGAANYFPKYQFDTNFLSIFNFSFFDGISQLSKGSLGLSAKISNTSADIDSSNFDSGFFFLDVLKNIGIIGCASYSLWLGGDDVPYSVAKLPTGTSADCGNLILGAVDTSLYHGQLTAFDMIPSYNLESDTSTESYPILPMGPIYIISKEGTSLNLTTEEFIQPVLLDSRYTYQYLPLDTIVQVALQIGAIYVESLGRWLVPCSIADLGVHLEFTFGDITIQAPLSDFLGTTYDSASNTTMHFSDGETACFLTMLSRSRIGFNILGGAFLKSIYMAVDLEDRSFAIAQARRLASSEDLSSSYLTPLTNLSSTVVAITSGHIPFASTALQQSNMTFSPESVASLITIIPDQLTATVYSDGLVSTGRSFYETTRSKTSVASTEASPESFIFSNSTSSEATKNLGSKLAPGGVNTIKNANIWTFPVISFIAVLSIAVLL